MKTRQELAQENAQIQGKLAQVRRALLTNPKLRGEAITRVLRTVPKSELRLMNKQTVYPPAVRSAAAKLAR